MGVVCTVMVGCMGMCMMCVSMRIDLLSNLSFHTKDYAYPITVVDHVVAWVPICNINQVHLSGLHLGPQGRCLVV